MLTVADLPKLKRLWDGREFQIFAFRDELYFRIWNDDQTIEFSEDGYNFSIAEDPEDVLAADYIREYIVDNLM